MACELNSLKIKILYPAMSSKGLEVEKYQKLPKHSLSRRAPEALRRVTLINFHAFSGRQTVNKVDVSEVPDEK